MNRETFINYCQALAAGNERYLENLKTREIGKVVSCKEDTFIVNVSGKRRRWKKDSCDEPKNLP